MKKLLILDNRREQYGNLMWQIAIKNGWNTFRSVASDDLAEVTKVYNIARYYGNTLHGDYLINAPFKLHQIPRDYLEQVSKLGFAKRWIKAMKFGDLVQPIQEAVFVKPAYQKYFEARVYKPSELIEGAAQPPDDIYVQEPIEFFNEYRCFVNKGEILTMSSYRINKQFLCENTEIPQQLYEIVQEICTKTQINWGIVLDFGQTKQDIIDGTYTFIEANEAWASGLYECDPNKCFDCIINSQYDT